MASTIEGKALKQQFETLQKQQQEKLLRRKQKKEEKEQQRNAASDSVGTNAAASIAFGVDDDLSLKLADPPQQGSIYSEELCNHLNDQIRELKDENGRLYKLLSERDLELRQLRKKQDIQSASGGVTNDTAATKIVELSKKVREMTSELEKEKTKCKQSTRRCLELETDLHELKNNLPTTGSTKKLVPASARSIRSEAGDLVDIKALQEKLKHAEMKVSEYRNQTLSLKKEISMAQKVIEQEVGEGVSVQQLINNSSGWRGRAQQIISLQKKVNELRIQVDRAEPGEGDLESEMLGRTRFKTADRQKEQQRRVEKERKENQERMVAEMKAIEADHESLKIKLDASKARNKVLSNEIKSLKQQHQTFLEKGKHDDELIDALFKQQSQLKSAMEDSEKRKQEVSQEKDQKVQQMTQKDMKERNLIDQLTAIVAEKERKVKALEQEIEQLRLAHLQKAQLDGVNEIFGSSRPSTAGSVYGQGGMYGQQQVQVDYAVVENCGNMTPVQHDRPESSHSQQHYGMDNRPSSSRTASRVSTVNASPNPVLLREMEELRLQCQEFKSLCQTATVERDKLAELIQVLQNRIHEATNKSTHSHTELLAVKRKNVELEKKLGKAMVDKGQSATARRTKSKISLQSINLEEDPFMTGENTEELSVQLEIQRDENEALKAALQSTLEAKEDDLKLYHQMLDETKTIFLQGLRQYRQSTQS